MATADRVYIVESKDADDKSLPRMVRATHPANALRHVAAALFATRVASVDDVLALRDKGVKVESIHAEQQQLPTT